MSFGMIFYYLLWPLIWFYSPLTVRSRVVLKYKNEILVVKNSFGSGKWTLPGGGIKLNEQPIDGAIREIKEELDLELSKKSLKTVSDEAVVYNQHGLLKRSYFFIAELDKKPKITTSSEITSHEWIKLSEYELPKAVAKQI